MDRIHHSQKRISQETATGRNCMSTGWSRNKPSQSVVLRLDLQSLHRHPAGIEQNAAACLGWLQLG